MDPFNKINSTIYSFEWFTPRFSSTFHKQSMSDIFLIYDKLCLIYTSMHLYNSCVFLKYGILLKCLCSTVKM